MLQHLLMSKVFCIFDNQFFWQSCHGSFNLIKKRCPVIIFATDEYNSFSSRK